MDFEVVQFSTVVISAAANILYVSLRERSSRYDT